MCVCVCVFVCVGVYVCVGESGWLGVRAVALVMHFGHLNLKVAGASRFFFGPLVSFPPFFPFRPT